MCRNLGNKKRHGFTLTEVAIVLGIVGIILGGIWAAAAQVYANRKVESGIEEVIDLVGGVRSLFAAKGSVDPGDLTQAAVNSGLYRADMLQSGGCGAAPNGGDNPVPCPLDPWGGEVELGGGGSAWPCMSGACSSNDFNIILWGLGTHCTAFLGSLVSQATSDGLVAIYSDTEGDYAVSTSTPVNDQHIVSCNGNVVLEFQL